MNHMIDALEEECRRLVRNMIKCSSNALSRLHDRFDDGSGVLLR